MSSDQSKPCTCWAQVSLHDGHCCMAEAMPEDTKVYCGHQEAGMAIHTAFQASVSAEHTPELVRLSGRRRGVENRCKTCGMAEPWPCATRSSLDRAKS